jgi:hypothetical protein
MKRLTLTMAAVATVASLSACGGSDNPPLVFGQRQTVGLSIGGSAPEQGAHLDLGYKDWNFAIIPVTIKINETKTGQLYGYNSKAPHGLDSASVQDTLSVFGQFSLDAEAQDPQVGLNKFFATGLAARTLAEGFKEKLSK